MNGIGNEPKKPKGIISPKKMGTSTSIPNPTKVGTQATVKMPKSKMMPDPFGKPSLFFPTLGKKEEYLSKVKHPTLCKLRDFLNKKHKIK